MISIVVLTFNSADVIKACLDSVFCQSCRDFEVIVADNGSSDKTLEAVKGYPGVVLIENKKNAGACKARNQAIEKASGEWVLTLDCDTFLDEGFLSRAAKSIGGLPSDTGILQPKILNSDGRSVYSCGLRLSWARRFFDIGKGKKDKGQFEKIKDIFGACSACAFYRKDMLETLKEPTGYFDERFFFLAEDLDLAWRARKKGFKALYMPGLKCFHKGNSSRANKKLRQHLCCRNRFYSIAKNEGLIKYAAKALPLIFYDLPRLLCLFFTNQRLAKAVPGGWIQDKALKAIK